MTGKQAYKGGPFLKLNFGRPILFEISASAEINNRFCSAISLVFAKKLLDELKMLGKIIILLIVGLLEFKNSRIVGT